MNNNIEKELLIHFKKAAIDNEHSLQVALTISITDYIKKYKGVVLIGN